MDASAPPAPEAWHAQPADQVLHALESRREGLTDAEAADRLARFGPNRLPPSRGQGPLLRFLQQFRNLLIYVLLGAAALAAAIGHGVDALVILAVVLVNAVIGYVQEGRAERALESIRSLIDPSASVLRDGRRLTIPAEQVVPGDIVLVEAGDRAPADLRLLKASNLGVDEAILTGESVPAEKHVAAAPAAAALGDRSSMVFSGTFATAGQGAGVAVATGAATELGRISALLRAVERLTTPLVRQMNQFARHVTVAVLGLAVLVFAYAAFARGYPLDEAFMAVVGLAVAAIPEGLPAVMTITLAVGVQRMARRNAIIRRLPAVETLGSVSVICSDKTGTLTRNEMMVRTLITPGGAVEAGGDGYAPVGDLTASGRPVRPQDEPALLEAARALVLCNDAELREAGGGWRVDGDPMEGALVSFAMKAGLEPRPLRESRPRLDEIPFDSRRRYMATLHPEGSGAAAYVKGAPERILSMCAVAPSEAQAWAREIEALAAQGQRVIGIARRSFPAAPAGLAPADVEHGLDLLGLVGLIDPPRSDAKAAIAECRAAGIQVKMITGDHAATAAAIAGQLGVDATEPLTGQALDQLEPPEFDRRAGETAVFARTTPENKLRLVESLQRNGAVVAMTGDGVNDAPALKRADVGVAMGCKGTEAAKEASEMVLADDNFASIVAAVREGRTVYDNLAKVVSWTLPTNGGEAFTIVLAILFGLTLPVSPVQILWINMITAVTLGLTLAFEPTEPGTMRRPPRPVGRPLLSGRLLWRVGFVSVLMVAGAFGVYALADARGRSHEAAQTLVVNTLVVMEIFYLFSVRYVHGGSITWRGVLGTPAVLMGVAAVTTAQLAFTYLPVLNAIFGSAPVGVADGAVVVGLGAALLVLVEAEKQAALRLGFADRR